MRLLADENVPRPMVDRLRAAGHDVACAIEIAPETEDDLWLGLAWRDVRILLTSDRDYGDLVFRQRQPSRGVVYLRLDSLPLQDRLSRLAAVWEEIEDVAAGRFTSSRRVTCGSEISRPSARKNDGRPQPAAGLQVSSPLLQC